MMQFAFVLEDDHDHKVEISGPVTPTTADLIKRVLAAFPQEKRSVKVKRSVKKVPAERGVKGRARCEVNGCLRTFKNDAGLRIHTTRMHPLVVLEQVS